MIQIRLWNDCHNNCSFCSLKKARFFVTPIESKKARLSNILNIQDNKIGLIGGEFFEGQLKGCEEEWLYTIKNIKCQNLFITANLINEQYLLDETLKVRPDILICTSYDTKGRFKTEAQKEVWLERVNNLSNVFCTIIPTQDMINDKFIDRIKCKINLCEPHLGINWLRNVDKEHYHEILIEENNIFNLPKRADLLAWLLKHSSVLNEMKNYKYSHFDTIIGFDLENKFVYEMYNRFRDSNFIAKCGHPHFSKCYADSDKCLCCDLEEL